MGERSPLELAISEHPLAIVPAFLASRRETARGELLRADIPSLLKTLELSGQWALALLRWAGAEGAADAAALEMVVRALGREGQHDAVCVPLDEMPLLPGSCLDVRAYTTLLHALSRVGRYERAFDCSSSWPSCGAMAGGAVELAVSGEREREVGEERHVRPSRHVDATS
ncbi:hypothetical protein ACP70R_043817 [Stipagrostis hirtigluma subsp. patula]